MATFQHIVPRYKLILFYNIRVDRQEQYYRFMLSSFVPAVQKVGVFMHMAWHIAYGEHPMRKIEFVTESPDTLRSLFLSDEWEELEDKLMRYVSDYERKVVEYRDGFQL